VVVRTGVTPWPEGLAMRELLAHVVGGVQAVAVLIVAATLAPYLPVIPASPIPPPVAEAGAVDVAPALPLPVDTAVDEPAPEPLPAPRPRVAIGFNPPAAEPATPPEESPSLAELPATPMEAAPPPLALPPMIPPWVDRFWRWEVDRFRYMARTGYTEHGLRKAFGDRYAVVRRMATSNARLQELPSAPHEYATALLREAEEHELVLPPERPPSVIRGPASRYPPARAPRRGPLRSPGPARRP
jgi:hypothetical protein